MRPERDGGKREFEDPLKCLSINEMAALLGVHPMTVRRAIRAGRLRAVRVGRAVRIPRPAAERFLADAVIPPPGGSFPSPPRKGPPNHTTKPKRLSQ